MANSVAYNMDCLEYMRTLPDNYFDLCVADPPYGSGLTEAGGCQDWFSKYHQDGCSQVVNAEREREREVQPIRKSGELVREVQAQSRRIDHLHSSRRKDERNRIMSTGGGVAVKTFTTSGTTRTEPKKS